MKFYFNPDALFPVRYQAPIPPTKYDQVIFFNWLNVEVPTDPLPRLNDLSHWRNKDVWYWVQSHKEYYYARFS